jgi:hypothetical protein
MKCDRCPDDNEATYRVFTDIIDMKVCSACADEARRLGIAVQSLEVNSLIPSYGPGSLHYDRKAVGI